METQSRQDGIAILLANRTYLYRLLHNFFGNEPTSEAINILNSDHTQTALSLLSVEKGLDSLEDFANQMNMNGEEALDKVRSEFTRLFIGPTKLPAPPWESVYMTKDRLIFQECTLNVRKCYLKYYFVPVHFRSEADDHLALELDFMCNLSVLAETAHQVGDLSKAEEVLKDQRAFLEEHLLAWVPQFAADLKASTSHPLYLGMTSMLEEFLLADLVVIGEILDSF